MVPAGLALMLGAVVVFGAISADRPAAAYVGMPDTYRAYWEWVSTAAAKSPVSLETGLEDLAAAPDFAWRYTRLADLCVEEQQQATCFAAFQRASAQTTEARQHRQAALALTAPTPDAAAQAWATLAAMPHLDPALVRRVMEAAPAVASAFGARLAQDSTDAGAAFGVALSTLAQNDLSGAEALLLQARRHRPDAGDIYRELGRIYFMQGQVNRQADVLREGVSRADAAFSLESSLLLRGNLGLALLKQQDGLNEAEATFREATGRWATLGDRGRVGLSRYRLGLVALQRQRYDDALAYADSALIDLRAGHSPNLPDALSLRGTAQLSLFRFSDAQGSLRAAVTAAQNGPQTPQARFAKLQAAVSLAQVDSWTGHYAKVRTEALAALAEAQEMGLADIEIGLRTVLGEAERFSGNLDQSVQQYNAALSLARSLGQQAQEVKLYQRLGEVMLEMQDPVSAKAYFERAGDRASDDARVLEGLGRTYYQFGNYEQAISLLRP